MKVEMFYTPGCADCVAAHAKLRKIAQETVQDLEWRELNIFEELDHAVALGVITLPSIAIDGELVLTSMPTPTQLREALLKRSGASA
jgi:thioredoxin 1